MGLVARSDVPGAVTLALAIADFLLEKKCGYCAGHSPGPGTHPVPGPTV